MWNPSEQHIPFPPWAGFQSSQVLLSYDGPRLLLRQSIGGHWYLAWWADADENIDRWIYLPVSEARLRLVLSGQISSREAITTAEDGLLYIVDADRLDEESTQDIWQIAAGVLPSDFGPGGDARLNIPIPNHLLGRPVRDRTHIIDAHLETTSPLVKSGVVGLFLSNFQRFIDAVGQATAALDANLYGAIPAAITSRTQLNPIALVPGGSVWVVLESEEQDDIVGDSLIADALGAAFELMDSRADVQPLTELLTKMNKRVAKSYDDLLKVMQTGSPNTSLTWQNSRTRGQRTVSISRELAGDIRRQIEIVENTISDEVVVDGIVRGGDTTAMHIHIQDLATDFDYRAAVSEAIRSRMHELSFESLCRATFVPELIVSPTTGEEKVTYTLTDIEVLGAQSPS